MKRIVQRALLVALTLTLILDVVPGVVHSQGSGCSPRPPVKVSTTREPDGTLIGTVSAGAGNITALAISPTTNVTFVPGGTLLPASNTSYPLNTPQVQFAFVATDGKSATMVPLTVTDACNAWPTFVGGGANVVTPTSGTSVVAAVGDIACDPASGFFNNGLGTSTACRQAATAQLAASMSPQAVLALGDIQYEVGSLAAFQSSYDLSWGKLRGVTRPVPGNHEYATPSASGYYSYFGTAAGSPDKGYYAFSLPGWRLIALNSNCSSVGGCQAGSTQEQWLRTELAAHPDDCILAYWHYPRFSSGLHGSIPDTAAFWQALYEYRADVVLSGHDHQYERLGRQDPNGVSTVEGIRSFVVGTGGRSLYPFGPPQPNSRVRISTFGVLKLLLRPGGYDWRFIGLDNQGVLDAGTGECHPSVALQSTAGGASAKLGTGGSASSQISEPKIKKPRTVKKKRRS